MTNHSSSSGTWQVPDDDHVVSDDDVGDDGDGGDDKDDDGGVDGNVSDKKGTTSLGSGGGGLAKVKAQRAKITII